MTSQIIKREYKVGPSEKRSIRRIMKEYFKNAKKDGAYSFKDRLWRDSRFVYAHPSGVVQLEKEKLYIMDRKGSLNKKLKGGLMKILSKLK